MRDQRLGSIQIIKKVGLKSYRIKLPQGCRLYPVFHCDLLSKTSNSTPLRHRLAEIENNHNEYATDFISNAKVDNRPNRRGLYLQFLTHFVGYDVLEWMLLDQVDDCKHLSIFYHRTFGLNSSKHNHIFNSKLGILLEMSIYINELSFS